MTKVLLIGFAGALGTMTRYAIGFVAGRALGTELPYGTIIVNLAGCFLIAGISHAALVTTLISPTMRLTLTTGFMGGLTTYSSFNLETTQLLQNRAWTSAALNFGITTMGCFVAGLLGLFLARRLFGS